MTRTIAALAFTAVASFGVSAQTTVHYREGQHINPGDVARILNTSKAVKTRSLRLLTDAATPARNEEPAPAALSLPVRFAFASAEISPAARPQLDALAEGIKLLPPGQPVFIEGHTDAVGSEDFNLLLSHRRARAVKVYLVRAHGIDELRLRETGFGKGQPITGIDPFAAENRRVAFRGG
jgi:outer membrane protein OmpA-like peptidoglycan-associated protein